MENSQCEMHFYRSYLCLVILSLSAISCTQRKKSQIFFLGQKHSSIQKREPLLKDELEKYAAQKSFT